MRLTGRTKSYHRPRSKIKSSNTKAALLRPKGTLSPIRTS